MLEKFYYGSGAKEYGFKKWRPERGLTTDQYEKELSSLGQIVEFDHAQMNGVSGQSTSN